MALLRKSLRNQSFTRFSIVIFVSILFSGFVSSLFMGCDEEIEPSIYSAMTDDNVELKLLRYRPTDDAPFNKTAQPILMLGGVGMNMNEFLFHTTDLMKDVYADMELPTPLADWAVGDEYIQNDPMLYYSLAHYLYLKGYDPWFGNLRGTGRDPVKSEGGIKQTNLDVFGCLDMPAFVDKITQVTGKKPIIGGHSTGGVAAYIYLQGAYMDIDEVMDGKNARPTYVPHVKMSPELAIQRNNAVKGFLAMDPAGIPPLPAGMNVNALWKITNMPIVIPLDAMMETLLVNSGYTGQLMSDLMGTIFMALSNAAVDNTALEWVHFFETDNMDPYVLDYYMRYATTNMYLRIFNQYYDWGMNFNMREGYNNGAENVDLVVAPPRAAGDGYYYYEDHMDNITTPTLCLLSEYNGLVASATIIDYLMDAKTPNPMDQYYIVPGTAHADLPCGRTAPTVIFPMIGQWIDQM